MIRTLLLVIALLLGSLTPVFAHSMQVTPTGVSRVGAGDDPGPLDVDVAVLDTGIDFYNDDLNVVGGYDCTKILQTETSYPLNYAVQGRALRQDIRIVSLGGPDWQDGYGHGTHVAGIIAAKHNEFGVVGVAPGARLWAIKVLTNSGYGTDQTVNCGLRWVLEHADVIDVVNMSLGGSGDELAEVFSMPCLPDDYEPVSRLSRKYWMEDRQLICRIQDAGIPVVVAAGNSDEEAGYHYPAGYPEPITVSNYSDFDGKPGGIGSPETTACAITGGTDDRLWTAWNNTPLHEWTSSYGKGIDISAPGTCIFSTIPGGYAEYIGTSMAAPHVTGIIARYKAAHPHASFDEVYQWLMDSAQPQPPGFDIDSYPEPLATLTEVE